MKTFKILAILLIVSLALSACSSPTTDSAEKIVSPQNQLMPIKGTWEVSKILTTENFNEEDKEEWLTKIIQFSDSYMSIGEYILENPQYQMKRVSGEQYLLFNSKSLPKDFVFPNKEVEVITVIDEDKFFCEVLLIKENELILKIQNSSFYLSKVSDEIDEYISSESDKENNENMNIQMDKEGVVNTGVLIGLRSLNKNNNDPIRDYNYRTLWISSTNSEINPILEMENIFFPRRSGFWKIQMENAKDGYRSEDYIVANNILVENNKEEIQLKSKIMQSEGLSLKVADIDQELDLDRWGERNGEVKRKINYVGNDYISVETTGSGGYIFGNEKWEKSKLELLPIDGLPNGKGIKISDLLEETGVISMKSAWEKAVNYLKIDNHNILYREELLENFGLERRLGHWFLSGRINYIKDKEFNVADYNIGLIPPSKVVFYDTLLVPWTNIKDRVPRALDAYTSPNKDIAIVLTKREILIYDIIGNELGSYPKEKLELKEGETIIMAEWATGHYVENWANTFKTTIDKGL